MTDTTSDCDPDIVTVMILSDARTSCQHSPLHRELPRLGYGLKIEAREDDRKQIRHIRCDTMDVSARLDFTKIQEQEVTNLRKSS